MLVNVHIDTRSKLRGFDCPYGRSSFKHIVRLTSADFHINLRFFQRFLDVVPSTVFATSFAFILSPPRNAFVSSFSFSPPGNACSYLISTHPSGRYTCWVLDCPCSLKPIGKKAFNPNVLFQLVDQYQPIALSRIHWWQSIKRSMGGQTNTPGSVIYLFVGWTAPGLSLRGSIEPRWLILYLFVD